MSGRGEELQQITWDDLLGLGHRSGDAAVESSSNGGAPLAGSASSTARASAC